MTYPKAIVLAAAFIAGAITYVNQPAQSQSALGPSARYLIGGVSVNGQGAWAIDTWTGSVKLCGIGPSTPKPVARCLVVQEKW